MYSVGRLQSFQIMIYIISLLLLRSHYTDWCILPNFEIILHCVLLARKGKSHNGKTIGLAIGLAVMVVVLIVFIGLAVRYVR